MGAVIHPAPKPSKETQHVKQSAKMAFQLMAQYHIDPVPENYAVWYRYALGKDDVLIGEIDTFIEDARPFTDQTNHYLYSRYVSDTYEKEMLDEASNAAMLVLNKVMSMLEHTSEDTKDYNDQMDSLISEIGKSAVNKELQTAAEAIINKTQELRDRGEELREKLDLSSQEMDMLREDLEHARTESERDFLTRTYNRKAFEEKLKLLMTTAKEDNKSLSLIMMDIDHFKEFNDKYGHLVGDQVLRQTAKLLRANVKGMDVVARYGGEEFSLLLPNTSLDGALYVAEHLRQLISQQVIRKKDTGENIGKVTMSFGVALMKMGDSRQSFIDRADDALYRSKKGGRNKVTQESL